MSTGQCFYPNGDPVKGENDVPCGQGAGVQCCPSGWTCQINGLCYLADQQYYGRYTCTDKTWKSPGCPQICTHNNTANGNEAVLQCSPGSFCCDANRPELSGGQACCDASPMRFSIDGNVAMTSMSEAPSSATAVPTNSASSLAESGSMPSSGQITSSIPSSQITGSTNATSVVFVTSVLNQDGKATVTTISKDLNTNPYTSHTAAIIGGAVGGAVALIALLALSFWLLRRRQGREPPHLFRILSLKDGLDSMYKDQRSPDSSSRSNAPSELVGSVPEPDAANDEKDWEKRYEKPGDVGRVSRLAPQRSARELLPGSPLSQSFSHETRDSAELPADTKIHELPDSPRPKSQRVAQ